MDAGADPIAYEDFERVDVRVGRVVAARPFPEARTPAYVLEVDLGPLGVRRSAGRFTRHYAPDDLVGRQVLCVVNLPAKQVGPRRSEVLVLGVPDGREDGGVVLVQPERDVPLGARLF